MIIKSQELVRCEKCGQEYIIREYEGLPGRWWTDYVCKEKR